MGSAAARSIDLEAVETAARRSALFVAARTLEHHLNADHSDHVGPVAACPRCAGPSRFAGRRVKVFVSVLGSLRLERAYYYCPPCDAGFCPRDRKLGLQGSTVTPAVTRMVGAVGAAVSFEEGRLLLEELAAVDLDAKTVERVAEALGDEIAREEEISIDPGLPRAPTLYLGMDGTGIPMRINEIAGRPGKQPDGSAKTREVKLCTVWSAEGRDERGMAVRDKGSVTSSAAIESAATLDTQLALSDFARRVQREADRTGFAIAPRQVVLGDGALWIWAIAHALFPFAIQIVDRFHAKEALHAVAKAIWGPGSALGREWADQRCNELDLGHIDALIRALLVHATACDQARRCADYIDRNRSRMDYPSFHQQGLCTSSGVVEAGCKVVVGARLKRAGMHWSLKGANAILALRCCRLSRRFEQFWESRLDKAA